MRYVSTRGRAPELGFADVLLAGLATDGGLYVPLEWPALPERRGVTDYATLAAAVMDPYVGDELGAGALAELCREAYATFRHPAVVPLVQIDHDQWLMELYHGPTLAFKDVALQLVGRMFDRLLAQRGERITIVGATSGDTGSAAIDSVKACANVDIVILYPYGRTSDVQRRQMTTVDSPNVHAVAVDGTFDDCQDLVKAMFADEAFRRDLRLSAVNSINWARVMAQIVYYVAAADHLAGRAPVTMCVPTGNFGNVLSGWIARQMGAAIDGFVIATNSNDILSRFVNDGDMSTRPVVPTLSPSMDIQVSSNFERLLFEINGRDGGITAEQLARFRSAGTLAIEPDQRVEFVSGSFRAAGVDDTATMAEIGDRHRRRPPARPRRCGRRRGQLGDRSPGQIPRCRRTFDRNSPSPPGPSRRPVRASRADRDARQPPAHGAELRAFCVASRLNSRCEIRHKGRCGSVAAPTVHDYSCPYLGFPGSHRTTRRHSDLRHAPCSRSTASVEPTGGVSRSNTIVHTCVHRRGLIVTRSMRHRDATPSTSGFEGRGRSEGRGQA
jgi:threonine synthase